MKRKVTSLKLKSFRSDEFTFYLMKGDGFDRTVLKQVFSDKEITQLETHFDQFYKLVSDNCKVTNPDLLPLLKKFKTELKSNHFRDMWESVLFAPERHGVNAGDETIKIDSLKNKELRSQIIIRARMKLFFLADIVIAFVMGNDKNLQVLKLELKRQQNLRRTYDLELLLKIKEIEEKTKNSIPKPTQVECVILANRELKQKYFNESDLLDQYGYPTQTLISIRDAYKAQKKDL